MNTLEIISNFMKANTVVTISEKQRSWLVGQAKKENLLVNNGWYDCIYFEDCFYQVRQCKTLASGGSYVGSRSIQGRYNIEKLFAIRFTENTKHTAVYNGTDLQHFTRENIGFEIIKPFKPELSKIK